MKPYLLHQSEAGLKSWQMFHSNLQSVQRTPIQFHGLLQGHNKHQQIGDHLLPIYPTRFLTMENLRQDKLVEGGTKPTLTLQGLPKSYLSPKIVWQSFYDPG